MYISRPNRKTLTIKIFSGFFILSIISTVAVGGYLYQNYQNNVNDQLITKILGEVKTVSQVSYKAAKKREPVFINLPGAKPIRAIVDDYSVTSSIWALVSKPHAISIDYIPAGLKIPNVSTRTDKSDSERSVRSDIEKPLISMFTDANNAGNQLMIGSGYRSAVLQQGYLDGAIASYGTDVASQMVALPGKSEHQTGLAVDISTVSRDCYLDTCFGDTTDGQWLVHNSYKYGFTLRYPSDKVSITGYQYEPWHFRYVGIDLATALHDSGLTLDEAWPYLQAADATLKANGAI